MNIPVMFDKLPEAFDSALILLQVDDNLVFVRNRKRHWELTGGKREAGETLTENVVREAYEEAGARVNADTITPIGYYQLPDGHTTVIVTANVDAFEEIPDSSETVERQLRNTPLADVDLSFHDNVYGDVFAHLGWGK